jgi:hypothetical protein
LYIESACDSDRFIKGFPEVSGNEVIDKNRNKKQRREQEKQIKAYILQQFIFFDYSLINGYCIAFLFKCIAFGINVSEWDK